MTNVLDNVELPSDRKFGLLFVIVFAVLAGYGYLKAWSSQAIVLCIAMSLVLAVITIIMPRILAPLNKAWLRLGLLLGKIVNPIVLGLIFFGILTPVSIATRAFGRDELRLKQKNLDSYWIERDPPGPASDSYKNQF